MRVKSLQLSGFRAFGGRVDVDLDADAVIVVGGNGQGKTSLFDGLLWGLTGAIPRFGSESSVLSLYAETDQARAVVDLETNDGQECQVVRTFDGKTTSLGLRVGGQQRRGPNAATALLEFLWPDALFAPDPQLALCEALERGIYLQQDLVTEFLAANDDHDRFTAVSELVGAGRVQELQAALERERNGWSRSTNRRKKECDELRERLSLLEDRIRQLRARGDSDASAPHGWDAWWNSVQELGVTTKAPPQPTDADAARALDSAVRELRTLGALADDRLDRAKDSREDVEREASQPKDDIDGLKRAVMSNTKSLEVARQALSEAQAQASALRRQQVELAEEREQMRAFAEMALRHLGEKCPVCEQKYDRETVTARLEALIRSDEQPSASEDAGPDVSAPAEAVEVAERELEKSSRALDHAEERVRSWDAQRRRIRTRLEELDFPEPEANNLEKKLGHFIEDLQKRTESMNRLQDAGERLSLAVARIGEVARKVELEQEVREVRAKLEEAGAEIQIREDTGEVVSSIIEALRGASFDVVETQLESIGRLLQRIYATADPHPAFRAVSLLCRMPRGRGAVIPKVSDTFRERESETPHTILSSSQLNVLAVSVFLALNLGMPSLPLETVILDDPFQSLDDVNLLGLIDLLRRSRAQRQLFISTHDERFAGLLERKLRPVDQNTRSLIVGLEAWAPEGPTVTSRELPQDTHPLRIAA